MHKFILLTCTKKTRRKPAGKILNNLTGSNPRINCCNRQVYRLDSLTKEKNILPALSNNNPGYHRLIRTRLHRRVVRLPFWYTLIVGEVMRRPWRL